MGVPGEYLRPAQPSFAHGEVNPRLFGRVDLQSYGSSLRTCRNAFISTEGAWVNRPGTQELGTAITSSARGSILVPFIFSATQAYVLEISASGVQIWYQGALVPNETTAPVTNVQYLGWSGGYAQFQFTCATTFTAGTPLVISNVQGVPTGDFNPAGNVVVASVGSGYFTVNYATSGSVSFPSSGVTATAAGAATLVMPYLQSELQAVRYTQSAGTLTLFHQNHPPQNIVRTGAQTFTLTPASYSFGPFLDQNTDGVTFVQASAKSGLVTLTASAPIFNANHVGALFELEQQDLSQIAPWQPQTNIGTSGIASMIGVYQTRSNDNNYVLVGWSDPTQTGDSNVVTGSIAPAHTQGVESDGFGQPAGLGSDEYHQGLKWLYQDSGVGIVLITAFISSTQVQGVVQPNYTGGPGLLPVSVVGGPTVAEGPWDFTGNGTTTSFGPLTGATTADPTLYYVTVGGLYVAPGLYELSSASAGNIEFFTAPANGAAIVVEQITALGQTTYWSFGAFSNDQGYPRTGTYFPDRLVMAGTIAQPVGIFASETSQYDEFQVHDPVVNSDAFTVYLNSRQMNAITDLLPMSDLLAGTTNTMWRLWPGPTGSALGPLSITATPQGFIGEDTGAAAVLAGMAAIYPSFGGRRLRDMLYNLYYDKYVGQELTALSRHLVPFGTTIIRLQYAPDPWQMVFALRSDGVLLVFTYVPEQQMVAWAHWDTGALNAQGVGTDIIEDIAVIPENGNFALYLLVNRTIAGVQGRYAERLQQWEVTSNLDWAFTDCSLTYDGRNTSPTTMQLAAAYPISAAEVVSTVGTNATVTINCTNSFSAGEQVTVSGIVVAGGSLNPNGVQTLTAATGTSVTFVMANPNDLALTYVSGGTVTGNVTLSTSVTNAQILSTSGGVSAVALTVGDAGEFPTGASVTVSGIVTGWLNLNPNGTWTLTNTQPLFSGAMTAGSPGFPYYYESGWEYAAFPNYPLGALSPDTDSNSNQITGLHQNSNTSTLTLAIANGANNSGYIGTLTIAGYGTFQGSAASYSYTGGVSTWTWSSVTTALTGGQQYQVTISWGSVGGLLTYNVPNSSGSPLNYFSGGAVSYTAPATVSVSGASSTESGVSTVQVSCPNALSAGQYVQVQGIQYTGALNPNGTFSVQNPTSSGFEYSVANPGSETFTYQGGGVAALTGGTNAGDVWESPGWGLLTASGTSGWANFAATDPGHNNVIQLYDASGNLARAQITEYISPTVVLARMLGVVPATLQNIPTAVWTFARTTFGGLTQLAGATVSVLADSNALLGPNGAPYLTVSGSGTLTLPNAYGVVNAGLQYYSDMATLALNAAGAQAIRERQKTEVGVYLDVTEARGLMVGTSYGALSPIRERAFEVYEDPTDVQEGILTARIYSRIDAETYTVVRQPYPLPAVVRMVIPEVALGSEVA